VIAGAGPDEARLRALAGGTVRFTGQLSPDELADVRLRAAVVLAPSRWEEPFGYSALEAMASGVPVLASDVGGLPELVGPHAVLPPHDHRAWTNALKALWSNPALRAARGREGLARAQEQFGEDRYLERLLEVYA
jgi:glycosyltransferase involved in cell wall biosynthesis